MSIGHVYVLFGSVYSGPLPVFLLDCLFFLIKFYKTQIESCLTVLGGRLRGVNSNGKTIKKEEEESKVLKEFF